MPFHASLSPLQAIILTLLACLYCLSEEHMRQKRRKGATNGGETGAAMDLEDDSSVNLPGNATK